MTGVSEATLISSFLPTTQDNFPKLNDKVPLCVKLLMVITEHNSRVIALYHNSKTHKRLSATMK